MHIDSHSVEYIFSIITACLNDRTGLECTYQSIKKQSTEEFEWIVIDGGSKDGTVSLLHGLNDININWISEPDHSLYDAMNKGIDRAKGCYLLFLNAGDELPSTDVLKKIMVFAKKTDWPDMLYGDAYERTQDGTLLYKKAFSHRWIWYGMFTHHQAMFYKKESIGFLRYRPEYPIGADYAFTAEILGNAANVVRLPFASCIFAQGGLSAHSVTQGAKDQWRIRHAVLGMFVLSRLFIRFCHLVMHGIKKYLPAIYKRIRFS